jgi:acyl-CoA synthetase (AMP-forming)/AMP-acid ligase II
MVWAEGEKFSKSNILDRVELCVRQLLNAGVASGQRVGVIDGGHVATYVSICAASSLGCQVVTLRNSSRERERGWATGVSTILDCSTDNAGISNLLGRPTIYGRNPVAKFPGGYAIATSGSTGRPKTVSISDAKLRAYSSYRIRRHKGLEGSRMSQNFEPVFDAFFESLTWAWGSNSTLVVASREDRLAIDDYVDLQQLTVWNGLPSQVKLASRLSHLSKHKSKTLKLAMFGGEPLESDVVKMWRDFSSGSEIVNSYGPTEATIVCIEYVIAGEDFSSGADESIPIGSSLPGLETRVVDPELAVECSIGELCLRGPQLFEGYDNPEDNAGRFYRIESNGAFLSVAGYEIDAWYRTGDLVSLEDGVFCHLGRIGREVKVAGARVDLNEVENTLLKSPQILRARACVVNGSVCAAIEVPLGDAPPLEEFTEQLRDYARPQKTLVMRVFPNLASGKFDGLEIDRLISEFSLASKFGARDESGTAKS